ELLQHQPLRTRPRSHAAGSHDRRVRRDLPRPRVVGEAPSASRPPQRAAHARKPCLRSLARGLARGIPPVTVLLVTLVFLLRPASFSKPCCRDLPISLCAQTARPAPVCIQFAPNTPMDTGAMRICTCRVTGY